MSERVNSVMQFVETTHKYKSWHIGSRSLQKPLQGYFYCDGVIEVFGLTDHPLAKQCYAWQYTEQSSQKYYAVLMIAPVDSEANAVKMVSDASGKKAGWCTGAPYSIGYIPKVSA